MKRIERSLQRITGGGLARLVSLILLMVLLIQTCTLVRIVGEISVEKSHTASANLPPNVKLEHRENGIVLSGIAPGFEAAVLTVDGVEQGVSSIINHRFSFSLEPGKGGSFAQVQVFGRGAPPLFSRIIPLNADSTQKMKNYRPDEGASGPAVPAGPASKLDNERQPPVGKRESFSHSGDLSRGDPTSRKIAITFDGGSHVNDAIRILDILKEKKITATFFLTGEFMKQAPSITRKIAETGHEVGNHSLHHPHLTTFETNYRHETLPGVTADLIRYELGENNRLYRSITGKEMVPLWRAPYGEHNNTIRRWACEAGYRHVSWTFDSKTRKSLDTLDWVSDRDSALFLSSKQIIEKILSFDRDTDRGLGGGIILLHLGSERFEDPFFPKLSELIDELEERGYSIGPVSSLISGK